MVLVLHRLPWKTLAAAALTLLGVNATPHVANAVTGAWDHFHTHPDKPQDTNDQGADARLDARP